MIEIVRPGRDLVMAGIWVTTADCFRVRLVRLLVSAGGRKLDLLTRVDWLAHQVLPCAEVPTGVTSRAVESMGVKLPRR